MIGFERRRSAAATLAIAALLLLGCLPAARAKDGDLPEKAVCQTCMIMGHGHGEEKIAGFSDYEGTRYFFCSDKCKETFDADPAGMLPPQLPRPAPSADLTALDGRPASLKEYEGRVLLVDFWATWCKPCVKLMPELQKIHDRFMERGFSVIGVSIDEKGREKVPRFLEGNPVGYPILLDTSETPAWESFGVKAIPSTFLIDRSGRIRAQWIGAVDPKDVLVAVETLLEPSDEGEE